MRFADTHQKKRSVLSFGCEARSSASGSLSKIYHWTRQACCERKEYCQYVMCVVFCSCRSPRARAAGGAAAAAAARAGRLPAAAAARAAARPQPGRRGAPGLVDPVRTTTACLSQHLSFYVCPEPAVSNHRFKQDDLHNERMYLCLCVCLSSVFTCLSAVYCCYAVLVSPHVCRLAPAASSCLASILVPLSALSDQDVSVYPAPTGKTTTPCVFLGGQLLIQIVC